MEVKYFGVLLVALMLVSPVGFATTNINAATTDASVARAVCPTKSTITVNCNAVDSAVAQARKWIGADGCIYVCDNSATSVNTCPAKSPIKVNCDATDSVVSNDAREWIGPDGCKYECENSNPVICPDTIATCQRGYERYSYTDANGCILYSCRKTSDGSSVQVSVLAEPFKVNQYDSFKAIVSITYNSKASTDAAQEFKVVTRLSGNGAISTAAPGSAISLAASSDRAVSIASSGSGGQAIATIVNAEDSSSSQERVDYVTLGPGESTSLTAYFTARTPGEKVVHVKVYSYDGTTCPPATNPAVGMPCKDNYNLVAQSSARVKVLNKVPPPLPETNINGVLALYSGWNMISIPVNTKLSMQKIAEQCNTKPYAWRLTSSGYVKEETLAPGYGYWIKAGNGCKMELSADLPTSRIAALFPGWNLVGAIGREVSLSQYAGNCQVTAGPWYYSRDATSTAAAASPYIYSPVLSPGRAYWIKVASACQLGMPSDEQPPVPPS